MSQNANEPRPVTGYYLTLTGGLDGQDFLRIPPGCNLSGQRVVFASGDDAVPVLNEIIQCGYLNARLVPAHSRRANTTTPINMQ